jgi:hypothetical protein
MILAEKRFIVNCMIYEEINMILYSFQYDLQTSVWFMQIKDLYSQRYDLWRNQHDLYSFQYDLQTPVWFIQSPVWFWQKKI